MYWSIKFNIENYFWPLEMPGSRLTIHPDDMLESNFNLDGVSFTVDRNDDNNRIMPNIGEFLVFGMFLDERASREFRSTLTEVGRLFETTWNDRPYELAVIDKELDLFDYERSMFTRWGLYDDIKQEVWEIERVVIRTPPPDCPDIFRLQGNRSVHFNIIVSDRFKQIYDVNGFTGLYFRRADLPLN